MYFIKMKCLDYNDECIYAYLHFNPHTNNYFTSKELLGAVGWKTKRDAYEFIISINRNVKDCIFEEFSPSSSTKITKGNRNEEINHFDLTHK